MSCARNFTLMRKKDGSYLDRKEVFRSTLKKQDMFSTVIQPNHIQVRKKMNKWHQLQVLNNSFRHEVVKKSSHKAELEDCYKSFQRWARSFKGNSDVFITHLLNSLTLFQSILAAIGEYLWLL